jgi:hypothetical protein
VHLIIGVLVADETELSLDLIVLLSDARLDLPERLEEVMDGLLREAQWNILEVEVVHHLDGGILEFSWLELGAGVLVGGISDTFGEAFFVLEADESHASLGVVLVDRDLG